MTGGLTDAEEEQLRALLGKVKQPYSRQFAEALLWRIPAVALELVVLRGRAAGRLEVLLTQRPDEAADPWAGAWHCPGTVARTTDKAGFTAMLERLATDELGCEISWVQRVAEDMQVDFGSSRALTFQFIYCAEVPEGAQVRGVWFDLDALPAGIIPEHRPMIMKAVSYYQAR